MSTNSENNDSDYPKKQQATIFKLACARTVWQRSVVFVDRHHRH